MLGRRIFLTPPRIHSIFTNKCFFSDISILSSREKAIKPFEEVSHLHQQVVRWNNDKMCAYCGVCHLFKFIFLERSCPEHSRED